MQSKDKKTMVTLVILIIALIICTLTITHLIIRKYYADDTTESLVETNYSSLDVMTNNPTEVSGAQTTVPATTANIGTLTKGYEGHIGLMMIIPPQVCAIGISALYKKPIIVTNENGEDEMQTMQTCPIDICFDHRVLDFGEVKHFLDALQAIFNNPDSILKY